MLEDLIANEEQRFVSFFNNSQAINPVPCLELLPGIGKKSMWQIINAREKKPFISFKDVHERTNVGDPVKVVAKRILGRIGRGRKVPGFFESAIDTTYEYFERTGLPNRVIMHVDLDYFYAQCEENKNPHVRGTPVVVCVCDFRQDRG